jgi:hypothetical protein
MMGITIDFCKSFAIATGIITGFESITPYTNARHSRLWKIAPSEVEWMLDKEDYTCTTVQELMLIVTGSSSGDPKSIIGRKIVYISNPPMKKIHWFTQIFVIGPQESEKEACDYVINNPNALMVNFVEVGRNLLIIGAKYHVKERRITLYVKPKTTDQFVNEIAKRSINNVRNYALSCMLRER